MNHKALFLASLLVIIVGIIGLIFHQSNEKDKENLSPTTTTQTGEQNITVALSNRPIASGALLEGDDFTVKSFAVPHSSNLIKHDISAIKSLNGYLVTVNIAENSYISPEMLESPDSPTFMANSLSAGEIAYRFQINNNNAYLFDSFNRGETVSLYLRTLETNKNKKIRDGITLESPTLNNVKNQQYVLTAIVKNMPVLSIKRYGEEDAKNATKAGKDNDDIGYISVRINAQDVKKIHAVEKAGDIFLIPAKDNSDETQLNEILPNLRTFKELRG